MCLGKHFARLMIIVSGLYLVLPADAAVLDNFNTYTAGTVGTGATGGVWSSLGPDSGTLQNESGNLLLSTGAATGNSAVFRALPASIPDGTAATTLFMRVRANVATVNTSIGLSDVVAPTTPGRLCCIRSAISHDQHGGCRSTI